MSFLKRFKTSLESLYGLPDQSFYVVAYSGGVDSHVLLQSCVALNLPVRAIHIHHGLQDVADDWVKHCQQICEQLNVQLDVIYVDGSKQRRESPEESARKARYKALYDNLVTGDCLLLGQHLNDQAETVLLQLLRGSGTAGLSAMPKQSKLDGNTQLRPLLTFSQNEILAFARENKLQWIEDPSNADTSLDRNYIRTELLPKLENRWPEVIMTKLATVATIQANNLSVLDDMAAIDCGNCVVADKLPSAFYFYSIVSTLSISKLKRLSSPRLLNMLRHWILQSCIIEIVEDQKQLTKNLLEELEHSVIHSQQDAKSVITFGDYQFRKYQDSLYLLHTKLTFDLISQLRKREYRWQPEQSLNINSLNIKLDSDRLSNAGGLKISLLDKELQVRFRRGGEVFHPENRTHSQRLKKLFQEEKIPPWERDLIPLIYLDDELIAVGDLWCSKKQLAEQNDEKGWRVVLSKQ